MSQFLRLEDGVSSLVGLLQQSASEAIGCVGREPVCPFAFATQPRKRFSVLPLFKAPAWGFKPQSPRQAGRISPHASEGVWHSDRELRPVTTAWYVVWANLPHVAPGQVANLKESV